MANKEIALIIQRLLSISDTGLTYGNNEYDKERYLEIREELGKLLSLATDLKQDELSALLRPTDFYATPLLDVRAFIVENEKICLVKGRNERSWALPGGFGEVGFSPRENILKEVEEETGFQSEVVSLLAIFDTNQHQLQSRQYIKLVFQCRLKAGKFVANHEISELDFFDIKHLPELSEKRISKEQLEILWNIYQGNRPQYID